MRGGFVAFWAFFRLLRAALIDAPQWIVGFFACCCLSLAIWLHRRHSASCNLSGGVVAATILARHQIDTRVYRVQGWMADCYYPKKNAILLSPGNFEGTTVSALGIAAHEVGHVLQRKRRYVPYWLTWLIHKPAHVALAACLWLLLIGAAAGVQPFVHAGVGCFAFYLLYLWLELVCEIDASRRGMQELLRHGFLQKSEAHVARRILRAALCTYLAVVLGTALPLMFFVPQGGSRLLRPSQSHSAQGAADPALVAIQRPTSKRAADGPSEAKLLNCRCSSPSWVTNVLRHSWNGRTQQLQSNWSRVLAIEVGTSPDNDGCREVH